MDGVVIDERRIHVDFSQSVAKLWHNFQTSKKEESKLDDKNKELILPNEVQKFEIKNNKDFMIDKRNYRMVFDNDNKNNFYPFWLFHLSLHSFTHNNTNSNTE